MEGGDNTEEYIFFSFWVQPLMNRVSKTTQLELSRYRNNCKDVEYVHNRLRSPVITLLRNRELLRGEHAHQRHSA